MPGPIIKPELTVDEIDAFYSSDLIGRTVLAQDFRSRIATGQLYIPKHSQLYRDLFPRSQVDPGASLLQNTARDAGVKAEEEAKRSAAARNQLSSNVNPSGPPIAGSAPINTTNATEVNNVPINANGPLTAVPKTPQEKAQQQAATDLAAALGDLGGSVAFGNIPQGARVGDVILEALLKKQRQAKEAAEAIAEPASPAPAGPGPGGPAASPSATPPPAPGGSPVSTPGVGIGLVGWVIEVAGRPRGKKPRPDELFPPSGPSVSPSAPGTPDASVPGDTPPQRKYKQPGVPSSGPFIDFFIQHKHGDP